MKTHHPIGVAFYIRQNKNKVRDHSIYCCIKVRDTAPKELCIKRGVKKEDWDIGKGRPQQKNEDLIKLSLFLDAIKAKLLNIYLDIQLNGDVPSAEDIKNIYLGKEEQHYTFLQLIDKAIKKYEMELAPGSLKNYSATRAYAEAFCKLKYKKGDILLKFLTYSFIEELKTYILTCPLKPNDPCTNNGCMKHLERIKKIVRWAYQMRFIDRDVFTPFKIKKNRYQSIRLQWDQLKTLENKGLQRPILNLVRDLFVFCCYTGMAPADMQRLRPHQVYADMDGQMWLTYVRAKSKVTANVPLLSPALALIKKYEWKNGDVLRDTVFPFVVNKVLNDSLKIISEICDFRVPLNFYVSRYTFATTVTLLQGVPITSIKEMLGHERIESTVLYAKAPNVLVGMDMQMAQKKIDMQRR